jgi:hypoxanthine phosphoribosyltransferase
MHRDIDEILLSEEQIRERIAQLGQEISRDYEGLNPVVIGVLKGVVIFYADMLRRISVPCQMDFMCISSYSGTESTGKANVKLDVSTDLKGRHVLVLEDIFDTGNSLQTTVEHLQTKEPASIRICTLLDKPERRNPKVTVRPDYTGFVIPNKFVVGYGMDFNEQYRHLPYVGVLKTEAYEK